MRPQLRPYDALGRLHGEEFLIVISRTTEDDVADVLGRVRRAASAMPYKFKGASLAVTVSMGGATGRQESAGELHRGGARGSRAGPDRRPDTVVRRPQLRPGGRASPGVTRRGVTAPARGVGYFSPVPIYEDIGISTGAYANFSLGAALLRIAEIAPAAEILSIGHHSLLEPANARVVELSGLPFTVHGPFLHFEYGSRSAARAPPRPSTSTAGTWPSPPSSARASTWSTPTCSAAGGAGTPRWSRTLERSFDDLAELQEESGVTIAVENLPFVRHTHFTRPGRPRPQGPGPRRSTWVTPRSRAHCEHGSADGQYELTHVHLHDNEGHVRRRPAPAAGARRHRRRAGHSSSPAPHGAMWCSSTRTRPTSSRACATSRSAGSVRRAVR